ncbi:hypothetical protein RQP46_006970 [Phenoliferia psychrophenolica]
MKVEILLSMGDSSEAGKVIAKSISAASQHHDLAAYLPPLYSLQATLPSPSTASSVKFAKSTLKRALASTSSSAFPQWTYHLSLQLAAMSDFAGALSALRDVERLAETRHDEGVVWASRVLIARLAVGEGFPDVAREAIGQVAGWMGFEMSDPPAEEKGKGKGASSQEKDKRDAGDVLKTQIATLGRQLAIQFVLVFCVFQAREGNVRLAKEKLKVAHQLLDDRRLEAGEQEGWTKINIHPAEAVKRSGTTNLLAPSSSPHLPPPPTPLSITLQLSPRSTVYGFAFLVSVAVHRDPFGSKPRSTLFANEGLKTIDGKLLGTEALPLLPPPLVRPHLASLAAMKVHLSLFSAELATMRSAFTLARQHLDSALATARTHNLWESNASLQARLTLDEGLLAQARADNALAEQCFNVVISLDAASVPTDLTSLALISLLTLRLSLGDPPASLAQLANRIVSRATSPSLHLIAELAQALTKTEITKSKTHLSEALKRANATLANHAKAVILALLANLFLFTRNDQAQKMLSASYNITRGMGARDDVRSDLEKTQNVPGDESVGNVRLGLWVGERLVESYKRNEPNKVKKQEQLNSAHRHVLATESATNLKGR